MNPSAMRHLPFLSVFLMLLLSLAAMAQDEASGPPIADPASVEGLLPGKAGNEEVARIMREFEGRGDLGDDSQPASPADTVQRLKVPDDLQIELVVGEPAMAQPLHITFDAQGRMWVVQYRQYPFPAGLKVVRYDNHLRAVFDRTPDPPPGHVEGADCVTVLEDTDGDGTYDSHRDVISGLNIATSVAIGSGGIWVMNPPYLMFYPDADHDAEPDADPVVHLSGFGLEDTHSVANNIRFGPDGWIYGANGSTTTANVRVHQASDHPMTPFMGQCIWRYHPTDHRFEIYAEGGGNTFDVQIDAGGRLFSGTNHGNTRGMYYPQNSYGTKSWGKHGPLTNPYAFGYFEHMGFEGDGRRFTQALVIYQDERLPERYRDQIIAINPLQRVVVGSRLHRDTSTYRTIDFEATIETDDRWFRPVNIAVGPDGAVYIADWYDTRLTHVDPRDTWHKTSGRVYRLSAKRQPNTGSRFDDLLPSRTRFDLRSLSTEGLLRLLDHPSRWFRHAVIPILAERTDAHLQDQLLRIATDSKDPRALEALWVLGQGGLQLPESDLASLAKHPDADIRRWTIRLLGDHPAGKQLSAETWTSLARSERDSQVRSQLASTAATLPSELGVAVASSMLAADLPQDRDDKHIPLLLWWALEAHCADAGQLVAKAFAPPDALWQSKIVRETILSRLMHRFAAIGEPHGETLCITLLELAPDKEARALLLSGFEEALARGSVTLSDQMAKVINRYRGEMPQTDLKLRLRQNDPSAIDEALQTIGSSAVRLPDRIELIGLLADLGIDAAVPKLQQRLTQDPSVAVRRAALNALAKFADPGIGRVIASAYHGAMDAQSDLRPIAVRVLASRPEWAQQLIREIDELRLPAEKISGDVLLQMRSHDDPELTAAIDRIWGRLRESPEETEARIADLKAVLKEQPGDRTAGQKVFAEHCGKCHKLFGEGGVAGPDLTGYERTNLDFLALATVDPSAAIREEFTNYRVLTTDGQVLVGLLENQTPESVTLRTVEAQAIQVPRDQIEDLQASSASLMPADILKPLSDQQIRDLFAYLMARTP